MPEDNYQTNVAALIQTFNECLNRPQAYYENQQLNRDARYCYWPGKTPDGRKWYKNKNDSEVFPWPGASDVAVPMVDIYAREDSAVLLTSLNRMRLVATGVESNDAAFANRTTNLIKWMLYNQMTERNREARLLANYLVDAGKTVLGVFWDRQIQIGYQAITMESIMAIAEQARQALDAYNSFQTQFPPGTQIPDPTPEQLEQMENPPEPLTPEQINDLTLQEQLPMMIADPTMEEQAVEVIQRGAKRLVESNFAAELGEYQNDLLQDYELKEKTARRIVKDLRETLKANIPIPTVLRNRPVFIAMSIDEDFFLPCDVTDMENARALFWREWVTAEQLKERVATMGYDEAWVKHVIDTAKGAGSESKGASASVSGSAQNHGRTLLDVQNLYGILHAYEKRCNEDGVPGIHYSVIHPNVGAKDGKENKLKQAYAKTELLNYEHGEYPFILFRREYLSRRMDDSRGYGEIAATGQFVVKKEVDTQINRSDLATLPPLHHPKGRPPAKWGPGVKVPASRNEYFFADTPDWDPGSNNVIQNMRTMWDQYFGRVTPETDQVLAQLLRQDLVDNWLEGWRLALIQMHQLCQQFMPNEFYFRVVGSRKGEAIKTTRDEIRGKFDVALGFNIADLDPEIMREKLKAVIELVGAVDVNGVTDRDELLAIGFEYIDPNLGERVIKPGEQASQQEIEDEQTVFAKIFTGIEVDVKPGQAYQLRERVLTDALFGVDEKGAPKNADGLARYQADPAFKSRYDKRMQQLKFQQQQQQNAIIGRLGA